jgi:hypothetical protein
MNHPKIASMKDIEAVRLGESMSKVYWIFQ